MNTTIYYFSGTGNSLSVAKKIQEKLGDAELIRITSKIRDNNPIMEADVHGFVFPVYGWGPPVIVEQFLKNMSVRNTGYVFAVATHAGGPGNTLQLFEKLIGKKGVAVNSAFDIRMPNNYVVGSNPSSKEEAQKIFDRTELKLTDVLKTITERKNTPIPGDKFSGVLKTMIIHPLFTKSFNKQARKFSVSDNCTGCKTCEKLCPVGNIMFNGGKKPEWRQHCEFCLACINWCPEKAIQFGKATEGKNRYHHPEVNVSELIRQ